MSEGPGDTWSELQAHKKKQESLRERIQRRKKERKEFMTAATEGIFVIIKSKFCKYNKTKETVNVHRNMS